MKKHEYACDRCQRSITVEYDNLAGIGTAETFECILMDSDVDWDGRTIIEQCDGELHIL